MGLIQKKDEKDEIDGIQIIERGEGPHGDEDEKIDLVAGTSAEHIAAGTTAEEEDARLEVQIAADAADENLMPEAQDEDDDALGSDGDDHVSKHKKTMIAAFVVAIVIAAVVGFFIGNGGFGGKGVGSSTLTEDQLDSTVASYSYNGKKSDITAREAIESQYSLDTVKDSDGNYTAPSADVILSYVRNKILLDAAEDEGADEGDVPVDAEPVADATAEPVPTEPQGVPDFDDEPQVAIDTEGAVAENHEASAAVFGGAATVPAGPAHEGGLPLVDGAGEDPGATVAMPAMPQE